jgi:hypothetical protein
MSGSIMFLALQILAVSVVAVAMALSLAHALELPGKLRLSKEHYLAVQAIYYPGFTIAGAAEPLGLVLLFLLLVALPREDPAFWLTGGAFLALLAAHGAYWLLTHPVNNFWLKDTKLSRLGAGFFSAGPSDGGETDWTRLRARWEYSHVARAGLAFISLVLLVSAVAV